MNGDFRRFLILMLIVTVFLSVAIVALAVTFVTRAGVVAFDVADYDEGVRVHFGVPAFPLNLAFRVVGLGALGADPAERRMIRAVAREIDTMPNVTLVEVTEEDGEVVRVRTHDRDLLIEIDAPHADVRVRVPRATFRRLAL